MKITTRITAAVSVAMSVFIWAVPAFGQQRSTAAHLLGQRAPSFAVASLDGKQIALSDYRGKAIVVNFWATWCGNCKVEMPWLAGEQWLVVSG